LWNVALIVEDVILFGRALPAPAGPSAGDSRLSPATTWLFILAAILPFGERWGLIDAWPAFALYASHTERTEVHLGPQAIRGAPESVRRHALSDPERSPGAGELDLTGWSREVRGVPVYPAGRACVGLAEALAVRYGAADSVRVVQWGRAGRWTGHRNRA